MGKIGDRAPGLMRPSEGGAWKFAPAEGWLRDLRHSLRGLRRAPAFTAVAIVSLALGIGASLAIFNLLQTILLRPLPLDHANRLVLLKQFDPRDPNADLWNFSYPQYREIANQQKAFSALIGYWGDGVIAVTIHRAVSLANIWAVTGNFYSQLGVRSSAGRLLGPADASGAARVAVLGYRFWRRNLSGRPALGETIRIAGVPFTVVGIAPDRFTAFDPEGQPDVTIPITAVPGLSPARAHALEDRDSYWVGLMGVRRAGVGLAQARAQLEAIWPRVLAATLPPGQTPSARAETLGFRLRVTSGSTGEEWYLRSQYGRALYALLGLAGLILLIACVNLASLMLARSSARGGELRLRAALGAGRWRLARSLLLEGVCIGVAGAVIGLALAVWASDAVMRLLTSEFLGTVVIRVGPDGWVLALAAALAIGTGALFSLAAAWRVARAEASGWQQSARTARGTGLLGKALIAAQVALSLVLVLSAGLLARSLRNVLSVPVGYHARDVLVAELFRSPHAHGTPNRAIYSPELVARVQAVPGVASAAISRVRPGEGFDALTHAAAWSGSPGAAARGPETAFAAISPGFFTTLRMQILRGRGFAWSDTRSTPAVAVVSRSLAARLFPQGAVGRRIAVGPYGDEPAGLRVVGVVNDARLTDAHNPNTNIVYVDLMQQDPATWGWDSILARTRGRLSPATVAAVRAAVASFGEEFVFRAVPLRALQARGLRRDRLTAALAGLFGLLALALAAIGLYGLLAFNVTVRTREIGVRMALGARPGRVLRGVLGEALGLAGLGIAVGAPAALAAAQLIRSLLFGIAATNWVTLLGAAALLALICVLAGYLPAMRAARLDPMKALRQE